MKVVVSTIGKFHHFDLARQLHKRQVLEAIFTGYPKFKLKNENFPEQYIRSFPWLQAPYMAQSRFRITNQKFGRELTWWANCTFDAYVASCIPQCDIFLAIANAGMKSGRQAQKQGSLYICDRGCSHIRYQDTILREEYAKHNIVSQTVDPRFIEREEAEYEKADAIIVPSLFAKNSFVEMGVSEQKVYNVPLGVELARFHPTGEPDLDHFDVLFVGAASIRKGLPYLLESFALLEHPKKRLRIVGTVPIEAQKMLRKYMDAFPITCAGHCPQPELKEVMSRSHVLVLPSVEDGFGLVMAEAMACGCPVIATTNTGAMDLYQDGIEGFIVPIRDPAAITDRMQELADNPARRQAMSEACLRRVNSLGGWDAYGQAMMNTFASLMDSRQ